MRFLFEKITGKTHRYSISDCSWFPYEDEQFLLSGATASISISRRDSENVLLNGELEGRCVSLCDRCGEQVEGKLYCEFVYLITTRKEQVHELHDIECNDEDVIILYLKEPEIDVDEILREQAFLAFPLRTLCSEDCKGICAGCGAVLNSEACHCSLDTSNSPFAVLKKLTSS